MCALPNQNDGQTDCKAACFDRKFGFVAEKTHCFSSKIKKLETKKALFQKHHGCASLGFVLSCTFSFWTALICISHRAVLGQDFTAPYHQHSSGLFPTTLSIVSIDGNHILPGSVCRFHPSVLSLFSHTLCLLPPTPQLLFLVSSRKPKPWWLKLTGAQKSSCWRTGTSCKQ